MGAMLESRTVIVTGAGRGLGRAYARACAAAGANVIVNDLDPDNAAGVAAEIVADGGTAVAVAGSVASWDVAARLVETAVERFGRLDGLVTNAAVIHHTPPWDEDEEHLRRIVETNVLGVQFCGTHVLRALVDQGTGGSIVTITSGARHGMSGLSAYGATKGAVASLTAGWALEGAAHGIRVNAVSPLAQTDMASVFPPGERMVLGPPERVAPLVVALLSDASRPVTGALLRFGGDELTVARPETTDTVPEVWIGTASETAASIAAALSGVQPDGADPLLTDR